MERKKEGSETGRREGKKGKNGGDERKSVWKLLTAQGYFVRMRRNCICLRTTSSSFPPSLLLMTYSQCEEHIFKVHKKIFWHNIYIHQLASQVAQWSRGHCRACAGDTRNTGSAPGLGRSPGGGNGNLLQDSWLGNPVDRGGLVGYSPCGHKEPDTTEHSTYPHENTIAINLMNTSITPAFPQPLGKLRSPSPPPTPTLSLETHSSLLSP